MLCIMLKLSLGELWWNTKFLNKFLLCFCPDEKDGLTLSLKESSHLIEEAKERESCLQAKVMSLERQIQTLTEREQEVKI